MLIYTPCTQISCMGWNWILADGQGTVPLLCKEQNALMPASCTRKGVRVSCRLFLMILC